MSTLSSLEIMMTGISSSIPRWLMASSTVKPSMPVMWISSSTTEMPVGFCSSRRRQSSPEAASAVSNWLFSIWLSSIRFMAESSTMSTLWRLWVGCRACGSG